MIEMKSAFCGSLKAAIPRFLAPRVNVSEVSHVDKCNDLNMAWLFAAQGILSHISGSTPLLPSDPLEPVLEQLTLPAPWFLIQWVWS